MSLKQCGSRMSSKGPSIVGFVPNLLILGDGETWKAHGLVEDLRASACAPKELSILLMAARGVHSHYNALLPHSHTQWPQLFTSQTSISAIH